MTENLRCSISGHSSEQNSEANSPVKPRLPDGLDFPDLNVRFGRLLPLTCRGSAQPSGSARLLIELNIYYESSLACRCWPADDFLGLSCDVGSSDSGHRGGGLFVQKVARIDDMASNESKRMV